MEFIGNTLYALLVAGCSHGNPDYPSSVIKVNDDGTMSVVADLSDYQANNPVAAPDPEDFEPDGTWYSMINVNGYLYAVEPNQQEIDRINPSTGEISRVIDLSKMYPPSTGWYGPTAIAYHGNSFSW